MTAENIRFPLLLVIFFDITLLVQPEALCFSQLLNAIHGQSAPENVLTANFARFF